MVRAKDWFVFLTGRRPLASSLMVFLLAGDVRPWCVGQFL